MRAFVLGFPQLSATQRTDALRFIGVPENDRGQVESMPSDPAAAARVALGLEESVTIRHDMQVPDDLPSQTHIRFTTTHAVSLERLMAWAHDTVTGLDQAAEQLRSGDVLALWLEGELGNLVRKRVYDELGFNLLDPARFPHRDESSGWFRIRWTPGRWPSPRSPSRCTPTASMTWPTRAASGAC